MMGSKYRIDNEDNIRIKTGSNNVRLIGDVKPIGSPSVSQISEFPFTTMSSVVVNPTTTMATMTTFSTTTRASREINQVKVSVFNMVQNLITTSFL